MSFLNIVTFINFSVSSLLSRCQVENKENKMSLPCIWSALYFRILRLSCKSDSIATSCATEKLLVCLVLHIEPVNQTLAKY